MDIKWDYQNKDFYIKNGDIEILSDSVAQEFCLRIYTPLGDHFFYPAYGSNVSYLIGQPNSPETHLAVIGAIQDCIEADDRITTANIRLRTGLSEIIATVTLDSNELEVRYDNKRVELIPTR